MRDSFTTMGMKALPAAVFKDVGSAVITGRKVAAERQHVGSGDAGGVAWLYIDAIDGPVTCSSEHCAGVKPGGSALARVRRRQSVVDGHGRRLVQVNHAEVAIAGHVETPSGKPDSAPGVCPEVDRIPLFLAKSVTQAREGDGETFLHPHPAPL
jgi:hypothetical protein